MDNKVPIGMTISPDTRAIIKNFGKYGKRFRSQPHFLEVAVDEFVKKLEAEEKAKSAS